ncbi:MAG: hypothetical protein ACLUTZ_00005 [Oliverpabstia sp.]
MSFVYQEDCKKKIPRRKEIDTASLEKAIQSAEALKEADYTADSWKVLQVALKNAKSALEAKKDQTSVNRAAALAGTKARSSEKAVEVQRLHRQPRQPTTAASRHHTNRHR